MCEWTKWEDVLHVRLWRGWLGVRAQIREAALAWIFLRSKSMGGMLTWILSLSNAVPLMPPVMNLVMVP